MEEEPEDRLARGAGTAVSNPCFFLISFFDLVLDRNFLSPFVARVVTIFSIPRLPRAKGRREGGIEPGDASRLTYFDIDPSLGRPVIYCPVSLSTWLSIPKRVVSRQWK